jgi:hypothetical protein
MSKYDYIGLVLNLPILVFTILITATHDTYYDVYGIIIQNNYLDIAVGILVIASVLVCPGLLMYSFVKKERQAQARFNLVPLIISVILFLAVAINFSIFLRTFSGRPFLIAIIIFSIYALTVLIARRRLIREKLRR